MFDSEVSNKRYRCGTAQHINATTTTVVLLHVTPQIPWPWLTNAYRNGSKWRAHWHAKRFSRLNFAMTESCSPWILFHNYSGAVKRSHDGVLGGVEQVGTITVFDLTYLLKSPAPLPPPHNGTPSASSITTAEERNNHKILALRIQLDLSSESFGV